MEQWHAHDAANVLESSRGKDDILEFQWKCSSLCILQRTDKDCDWEGECHLTEHWDTIA